MTRIDLHDRGMGGGTIPTSIGALGALTYLDLSGASNSISGTLPSQLGTLTSLVELAIVHSKLTGEIPSTIGGMTALTRLDLGANLLSGELPNQLGSLTRMVYLSLCCGNKFSGAIPSTIGDIKSLNFLFLQNSSVSDAVPASFCNLLPSIQLEIQSNPLLACYPSCLSSYSKFAKDTTCSICPSSPTIYPTRYPSVKATAHPTRTQRPTTFPTFYPPSLKSSSPTGQPSRRPTSQPSMLPTNPTGQPTLSPSQPSGQPSRQPSAQPTRQPTGQPSRQPTRQPTGRPTMQPSGECPPGNFLKGGITCTPCSIGQYSSGGNSARCTACLPGKYSAIAGLSTCLACSVGKFNDQAGRSSCRLAEPGFFAAQRGQAEPQACLPGTAAGSAGSQSCVPCSIGAYAAEFGSVACTACPGGRVTPFAEATSLDQCLSPASNFAMGTIVFLLCLVCSIVYLFRGGYVFAAFMRRERVIMPQVKAYHEFYTAILKVGVDATEGLWRHRIKSEIEAYFRFGAQKVDGVQPLLLLRDSVRLLLFIAISALVVSVSTALCFLVLLARVLFQSLIIWKQTKGILAILDYRAAIKVMTDELIEILGSWLQLPAVVRELLEWVVGLVLRLFDYLAIFKVDFSGLNVTCQGSIAPFELLQNLLILGGVIIVVQSGVQVFRSLVFQSVLSHYAGLIVSREYNHQIIRGFSWLRMSVHYFRLFGTLIFIAAVQLIATVVNLQSVLQFAMSLVSFKAFVESGGLHFDSPACNLMEGLENYDYYLAFGTSALAYMLVLPVGYELASVLCPHDTGAVGRFMGLKTSIAGELVTEGWAGGRCGDLKKSEQGGSSERRPPSPLGVYGWIRAPLAFFSPDILLLHLSQSLIILLRKGVGLKPHAPLQTNMPFSVANPISQNDPGNPSSDPCHRQEPISAPRRTFMQQGYGLLIAYWHYVSLPLRPLKDSPQEPAWLIAKSLILPPYLQLLREELAAMTGLPSDSLFVSFSSLIFLVVPVGHAWSAPGRKACRMVLKKYMTFLHTTMGIWTRDSVVSYDLHNQAELMRAPDEPQDKHKLNVRYRDCLAACIAPRAVLLQLVPYFTVWSVFSIATAECAVFATSSSGLLHNEAFQSNAKVFDYIITDPLQRAEEQEIGRLTERRWIIWMSAIRITVLNSRAVIFALNTYLVFLSVYILYCPANRALVASAVLVVSPWALAQALGLVLELGKAMNIKDVREIGRPTGRGLINAKARSLHENSGEIDTSKSPEMQQYILDSLCSDRNVQIAAQALKAHHRSMPVVDSAPVGTKNGLDKCIEAPSTKAAILERPSMLVGSFANVYAADDHYTGSPMVPDHIPRSLQVNRTVSASAQPVSSLHRVQLPQPVSLVLFPPTTRRIELPPSRISAMTLGASPSSEEL